MYQHTQRAGPIMFVLAAAGLLPVYLLFNPGLMASAPLAARITLGVVTVVLIGSGITFSSLTITVSDTTLTWRFGPGLVKRSVALRDVAGAEPTTTAFWEGWGIHFTNRGWLYNVTGRAAVLVRQSGGKTFLLGTDEPEALAAAIRAGAGGSGASR